MGSSRRWAKFKQLAKVISSITGNVDGSFKGALQTNAVGGAMQRPATFLASNGHHQHFHFSSKAADQQTQQLAYKQQHLATFNYSRGMNRGCHSTIQNRSQQRLQAWQNSANSNVININSSLLQRRTRWSEFGGRGSVFIGQRSGVSVLFTACGRELVG
ncbi:hypothetical protein ACLOJK_006672 [Asimina triloba]